MKFLRLSAALFALSFALAACGGGGGGSSSPVPNPGGGGGGGSSPTPGPTPSSNSSPTPAPTATPSGSVPVNTGVTLSAEENFTNPDMASWYTSGTASWSNHAGVTATGGTGQNVDSDNCDSSLTVDATGQYFHSHSFVGIYYNGTEEALPQAIGMNNPIEPTKGNPSHPADNYEVENATCMYHVHTHDFSGLVHVEVPAQAFDPTYHNLPGYANLQTLIDIWGASLTSSGLTAGSNAFAGPTAIYTGLSTAKDAQGNDLVNSYSAASGAVSNIMLQHHEAIWIVIGNLPTGGLPQVRFVITN